MRHREKSAMASPRAKLLKLFTVCMMCISTPSVGQSSSSVNEKLSANAPSNMSAVNEYVLRSGGSDALRTQLAEVCLAFIDGWKQGFDIATPDAETTASYKRVCSSFVKAAMAGDAAWLNRYIQQASLSAVDQVSLISYCDAFKEGAMFGLTEARSMASGGR